MKRWQDTELWQPRFLMCGETLDTGSWFYCVTCSTTFRSRKRRYNTLYRPLTSTCCADMKRSRMLWVGRTTPVRFAPSAAILGALAANMQT